MTQFLFLLTAHWVADFVCQTHWQAQNKSRRLDALGLHVGSYTIILGASAWLIFGYSVAFIYFVMLNGALHFLTDAVTSRWTAKLYAKEDWHNFFVIIGLDQLVHQLTLAFTMLSLGLAP